jgi:hypothetical protein
MIQSAIVQGQAPKQGHQTDIISGFGIGATDKIEVTYSNPTTEIYTFKKAGLTVATITVVYTDSTKASLSSATKS